MSSKKIILAGLMIGSGVGGYLPKLWGGSVFSGWAILFSLAGGIAGIWIGYKLTS